MFQSEQSQAPTTEPIPTSSSTSSSSSSNDQPTMNDQMDGNLNDEQESQRCMDPTSSDFTYEAGGVPSIVGPSLAGLRQAAEDTLQLPTLTNLVSDLSTPSIFALSFPTLFPLGKGDITSNLHSIKIPFKEYRHHLTHMKYQRFSNNSSFMYFLWNYGIKKLSMTTSSLFVKRNVNETSNEDLEDTLHRLVQGDEVLFHRFSYWSQSIPGTPPFWFNKTKEMTAMVDFLPTLPQYFFTFSFPDYHSPDLHKFLGIDPSSNLYIQLKSNLALCLEYFWKKWQSFRDEVLGPILGMIHYYERVEFQARGTPHIHGVIWSIHPCIPELLAAKVEEINLLVCQFIGGSLKLNAVNPHPDEFDSAALKRDVIQNTIDNVVGEEHLGSELDFAWLSNSCLLHKCSQKYCMKGKPTCRFRYPFELSNETKIIEDKIIYQRNCPNMVKTIKPVVQSWRGNCDITFVESYEGLINYILKYIGKKEVPSGTFDEQMKEFMRAMEGPRIQNSSTPSDQLRNAHMNLSSSFPPRFKPPSNTFESFLAIMSIDSVSQIVDKFVDHNNDIPQQNTSQQSANHVNPQLLRKLRSHFKRLSLKVNSNRDSSEEEVLWICMNLPLVSCSISFADVSLNTKKVLSEPNEGVRVYKLVDPLEFYMHRPAPLEDVSLYILVAYYGQSYNPRRKLHAPKIHPDIRYSASRKEDFYKHMWTLHRPWRNRSELSIDDTETYENVFKQWMEMNLDKVPPYVQREIKFNEVEYQAISEADDFRTFREELQFDRLQTDILMNPHDLQQNLGGSGTLHPRIMTLANLLSDQNAIGDIPPDFIKDQESLFLSSQSNTSSSSSLLTSSSSSIPSNIELTASQHRIFEQIKIHISSGDQMLADIQGGGGTGHQFYFFNLIIPSSFLLIRKIVFD